LKTLISVVSIQVRATVSCVRSALKRLPELMQEKDSDVSAFNLVVGAHIDTLNSVGATCEDLLHHLFEAYQSSKDDDLAAYVKDKEGKWEDNTIVELTPATLMTLAEEKFKTLSQKKAHKTEQGTSKDDNIVALNAQLLALRTEMAAEKKAGTGGQGGGGGTPRKSRNDAEWAWKGVAPTATQSKEKKFKGKEYVYCPFHGETKWVLKAKHANGCRNDPSTKAVPAAAKPAASQGPDKRTLQYAKAFMHAMEESEEQDEGEETDENV
jgi:hypothetical protein